jgi:hypothetical protein
MGKETDWANTLTADIWSNSFEKMSQPPLDLRNSDDRNAGAF